MTTSLVCDASVVIRYLLPSAEQPHYQQLWQSWMTTGVTLYAPTLWLYEVMSGLSKGVFFKAITSADAAALIPIVHQLPVELVVPTADISQKALTHTQRLKRKNPYDSYYVVLAQELGCELWTADKKLFNAVGRPWVKWAGI